MKFFEDLIFEIRVLIRKAAYIMKVVTKFITVDLWRINPEEISSNFKARAVRDLKILILMFRTFSAQKIGFQAKTLSYLCVMSLVPMVAIIFALASGVGLSDVINDFLTENIKDGQILEFLTSSANNIIGTAKSGSFGLVSALFFVWMVIWMMICVERVFNSVWQVTRNRNLFKRVGMDIVILFCAPFVIAIFFSGSVLYSKILDLVVPNVQFSDNIKSFTSWAIFAASAIFVISAMYKYIPATRVRYRYALKTAVLAGLVFTVVQYLYLETQVIVSRQSAIYGAVAAIPLFLIWLNIGWTIILYGAELSYAFQTIDLNQITDAEIDLIINKQRRDGVNAKRYTEASDVVRETGGAGQHKVKGGESAGFREDTCREDVGVQGVTDNTDITDKTVAE